MKDVSSTSFGLLIAYLLPGFAGFFAISFWSESIRLMFLAFVDAPSNVGRFLLVIVSSLVIGLEISVVRWLIFELGLCKAIRRESCDFSELRLEPKFSAFRGAVDEFYRYHQFWGGMAIVIPFLAFGIVRGATPGMRWVLIAVFLLVEGINIAGAYSAFKNYIDTASKILSKSSHG